MFLKTGNAGVVLAVFDKGQQGQVVPLRHPAQQGVHPDAFPAVLRVGQLFIQDQNLQGKPP
jgi:hypothetical protein